MCVVCGRYSLLVNYFFLTILVFGCGVSRQQRMQKLTAPPQNQTDQIAQVATILRSMPEWLQLPRKGSDIISSLTSISHFPTEVIRAAEFSYLNSATSEDDSVKWDKLMLTHRYIFAVPARVRPEDVRFFGGWGRTGSESTLNLLWPFEEKQDGSLHLRWLPSGYLGPDYRALDEFDYFSKRFGRRAAAR
jgi:hypothetical protein